MKEVDQIGATPGRRMQRPARMRPLGDISKQSKALIMKISAFDIRTGNLIEHNGKLWRVYKKHHVKPGKGGAFVQVEMKDISAGTKLNERFRSEDRVERAHVEARSMQYLYQEGDDHVFMDNQTYEQMSLTADELEGQLGYLKPDT
ncbi:MAG: hypothetical protein V3R62_05360, partial [Acidiferrobacterales bacterium]